MNATIDLLRSPAYVGLSKIHTEWLEKLELEASVRGVKVLD